MSTPISPTKRLVGWTILLAWAVVVEELVRLYGPLWGAAFVLGTLTAAVVLTSRGAAGAAEPKKEK